MVGHLDSFSTIPNPDFITPPNQRKDFEIIASLVEPKSRILDLGCGDGSLLKYLSDCKQVAPQGIEKNWKIALSALAKGIPVLVGTINHNLDLITDKSFDMLILSKTIQELVHPDEIIQKMLSKGRTVVISFLNYGYWFNRIFFFYKGKRPISDAYPLSWYDSPDLRPLSIKDFEIYCHNKNIRILKKFFLKGDWTRKNYLLPNFFSGYAIYHLEKKDSYPKL